MERDFSTDFESEALPSIATLERYVGGEMADDERERLEAQIAKDPLLADAVDGLRMSLGDTDMTARLSRIRSRVAASVEAAPDTTSLSSKRKSRVKPFPQYLVYTAVAAGFALLLVFVGLMRDSEQAESTASEEELITQNQIPDPSLEVTPMTDSITENESQTEEPTTREAAPRPPSGEFSLRDQISPTNKEEREGIGNTSISATQPPVNENATSSITDHYFDVAASSSSPEPAYAPTAPQPSAVVVPTAPTTTNSYTSPPTLNTEEQDWAKLAQEAIPEDTELIREPTMPTSASYGNSSERARQNQYEVPQVDFELDDVQIQDEADQTAGALSKAQLMANLLMEAIRLHDSGELDSANLLLDEVLLSEKENVVAAYYKGESLMQMEEYKEAIPYLITATAVDNSTVIEDARWQLARAYLASNKKRKAKSLLTEISGETGKYQAEAAELLQNID